MSSRVYFTDMRANSRRTLLQKYERMIQQLDPERYIKEKDSVAIKLHFGERGNFSFIRPVFARPLVDVAQKLKANPFLTDCNTLYAGSRNNAIDHVTMALRHGFDYAAVNAPVIIADGLYGGSHKEITMDLPDCRTAYIGLEIANAKAMVTLTHVTGHELTGYGGVLNNLGMGCAARAGKLFMHSNINPKVLDKICRGCAICEKRCPAGAIKMIKNPEPADSWSKIIALKDDEKCIGCGACVIACPFVAMILTEDSQTSTTMHRMIAHAKAVLAGKEDKCIHFAVITNVSPACDCNNFNDSPIVPDLGIMASTDPVALDSAVTDMVNKAAGMPNCQLNVEGGKPGGDKFHALYPNIEWQMQLNFAQELGIGTRDYQMVVVS